MITDYFQASFLAVVQGISEFIPVSSSAHLIILSQFFDFSNQSIIFDVGLHLGSLIAIVFYFRNELLNLRNNKELLKLIIIGSTPLVIIGYILFYSGIINIFRNVEVIAWTTLIFGLLLYYADKSKVSKNFKYDLNTKNILIIGIVQTLSLIPGVSRAGITITAARILKFNRVDSSKISFLLSIPALAGASVLSLKDIFEQSIEFNYLIVIAIISSFIFSFLTVKFFLIYINKFSMNALVIYRIIIALILFNLIY